MEKPPTGRAGHGFAPLVGASILHVGIVCCAITIVIALAVAFFVS